MLIPFVFFFFNDTATTEIYTLSLHDALPISSLQRGHEHPRWFAPLGRQRQSRKERRHPAENAQLQRSEEHTSELQSRLHLVCRLLLEKKKQQARHCICGQTYAFPQSD